MTAELRSRVLGMIASLVSRGQFPKPTAEPVAFLYNGVRLPGLPEVDLPYTVIVQMDYLGMNGYSFWASSAKSTATAVATPCVKSYYNETDGVWNPVEESTTGPNMAHHKYIWANHDIYDSTGTKILAASEPVPVYE